MKKYLDGYISSEGNAVEIKDDTIKKMLDDGYEFDDIESIRFNSEDVLVTEEGLDILGNEDGDFVEIFDGLGNTELRLEYNPEAGEWEEV